MHVFFGCSPLLILSVLSNMGDGCVCALLVFTTAVLVSFIKCEGWLCLCSSGVNHCWSCLCYQMWGTVVLVLFGCSPLLELFVLSNVGMVVFLLFGCSPLLDLSVFSNVGDGCVCVLRVLATADLVCAIKHRGWLCLCSVGTNHCCTYQFYQT